MPKNAERKNEVLPYKMGGSKGVASYAVFFTVYTYYITVKCQSGNWDILTLDFLTVGFHVVIDRKTTLLILVWFLAQCCLYVSSVGGKQEKGVTLQSGQRLTYNTNALVVLGVNLILFAGAILIGYDVTNVSGSLVSMLKACVILCFSFSLYLYARGAGSLPIERNPNGCSGNKIYDWFMGRELNPRWRSLDIKYVLFRSCIIGWILLNLCNLVESWVIYRNVNATLLLLNAIQLTYIVDYFWFESGVIVSRDIVHEGFGYNILIQFVMIPFCFCVQTRYVLTTNTRLSPVALCIIVSIYVLGYYIYRGSNSEKNNFRKNPRDPKLQRFSHLIPYLGTICLVLLLQDRENQDSEDCKRKYGADWDKYCQIVKYRIIPGIY